VPGTPAHPSRAARIVGRRYLLHGPGFTYCITTVVLILGAINGQNNLLFAIFGLAAGGLVISGILSGANLMGIRVERLPPREGVVGSSAGLRYRVRNVNRWVPAISLLVEEIDLPRRSAGRLAAARGFVASVRARESVTVEASPACLSRGSIRLARFRVTSTFPFGLTRKSVELDDPQELLVLPRAAIVLGEPLRVTRGDRWAASVARASRDGDEFHALREYAPGDAVRSVAWRASARVDPLLVRVDATRRAGRVLIAFEAARDQASMERMISAAAGMCLHAQRTGRDFALAGPDSSLLVGFGSGPSHVRAALRALATWEADASPGVAPVSRERDAMRVRIVEGSRPLSGGAGSVLVGADDPATFRHESADASTGGEP
jgi:uncharacterized protein (DUF58 family)